MTDSEFQIMRRIGINMVDVLNFGGSIETVLDNAGYERINYSEDQVRFNPRIHRCEESTVPQQPVIVQSSGWGIRVNANELHILMKAKVIHANI